MVRKGKRGKVAEVSEGIEGHREIGRRERGYSEGSEWQAEASEVREGTTTAQRGKRWNGEGSEGRT